MGKIDGRMLKIQATRSTENDLVIVVSNNLDSMKLLDLYMMRWAIECLFGNLKSKGFNFEDTHFTKHERIDNLTKLLVLVHAIALLLGIIRAKTKPIVVKIHGYKQHSYFRYGLDFIIGQLLQNFVKTIQLVIACFNDYKNWGNAIEVIQPLVDCNYLGDK